jgi:transketolase
MRKEFAAWMETYALENQDVIFLTGDLGFMALENVQAAMGTRFVNAGVSEQNMISLAAGMAQQGLKPFCYSIAPFIVFRPAEQIRLDVGLHNMNVKIVGNGGGYGYGIMGATHHALEDLAVLSSFPNLRCFVPYSNEDVKSVCQAMSAYAGSAYLRLGFGAAPVGVDAAQAYAPVRRLTAGHAVTVVGIGPVLLNALAACSALNLSADVFAISELPVSDWGTALAESAARTHKVLVVEEHVQRGGLGEHVAHWLLTRGVHVKWAHAFARGYPNQRYGSQAYHQQLSGLDAESLQAVLRELTHG